MVLFIVGKKWKVDKYNTHADPENFSKGGGGWFQMTCKFARGWGGGVQGIFSVILLCKFKKWGEGGLDPMIPF